MKKFIISITDHGVFVGTVLLLNIFIMRTTDMETFGLYTVYYSIFIFLVGLHNAFILEPYTVFSMGKFKKDISFYYRSMLKLHGRFGIAIISLSLFVLLFSVMAYRLDLNPVVLSWTLVPAGVLAALIWKLCRVTYYVQNKEVYAAFAAVCFALFIIGGCTFLYFAESITALNMLMLLLTAYCLPMVIGLIGNKRLNFIAESKLNLNKSYWKDHASYSKWVVGSALILPLTYNGYFWLFAYYSQLSIVAEVKSVVQLVGVFQQLLAALFLVTIREFSCYIHDANYNALINKVFRVFLGGIIVITIIYIPFIVYGDKVVSFIYGDLYAHISIVFKYCLFLTIFQLGSYLLNVVIKILEKPNLVFYGFVASALMTVVFGFYLATNYGLQGVITGLIISEISVFCFLLFHGVRIIRQSEHLQRTL